MMAHKQHETLATAATVNVATIAIVAAVVLGHCKMQSHIWSSVTQTEPQLFIVVVDVLFQYCWIFILY